MDKKVADRKIKPTKLKLADMLNEIAEVSEMNKTGDSVPELLGLLLYIRGIARGYQPGEFCRNLVAFRRKMRKG